MALARADRIEQAVLAAALKHADRYRVQLDRRLARLIISELASMLRKGRR